MCVVSVISETDYTHALFHVLAMQRCTMGSSQFPITKLFYPGDVKCKRANSSRLQHIIFLITSTLLFERGFDSTLQAGLNGSKRGLHLLLVFLQCII